MTAASGGHTLFLTEYGLLGFGPAMLSPEDVVVLPYHSRFPIALREDRDQVGRWTFLGLVSVPGIQDLELCKPEVDGGRLVAEDFVII